MAEKKEYIIQKAFHIDAVPKKYQRDYSNYMQLAKYDGCCAILLFNAEGEYLGCKSRTGEDYVSMDEVGQAMQATGMFKDVAIIGEAWWPGKGQFNLISGEFRRGVPSGNLRLAIHDAIPLADFRSGTCSTGWWNRFAEYWYALEEYGINHRFFAAQLWSAGSDDPQQRCNSLVNLGGFDGLVLKDPDGTWEVGAKTPEILKVKAIVTLDLPVLEVNVVKGEKTGRDVYKLVVEYNGKRLGVGSGVPHLPGDVPNVGDIVEIAAMMESSDGLLREPRFKAIRFDKATGDHD